MFSSRTSSRLIGVKSLDALEGSSVALRSFYIALLRDLVATCSLPGVLAFSGKDSTVKRRIGIGTVVLSLLMAGCFSRLAFAKDEPKWIEVHSAHFSVLTDAGDKRGREVALRMEHMRAVFGQLLLKDKLNMPVPITVIALKSDKQYGMVAPAKQSMAGGVYVPGADRIYILLDSFGSLRTGRQVERGAEPNLAREWQEDISDEWRRAPIVQRSLTQLVGSPL